VSGHAPRVTLGVPVYNGAEYLAETLDSLLAQDFDDFEIVISDNASTDETAAICRQYAERDPRIIYTRNEKNMGGAYNYSRLVGLARGEYFKWASADDLCAPGFLKSCVAVLDAQPDVVLAYPLTMMIGADGAELAIHQAGLHLPWPEAWRRMRAFAKYRVLCNPCFGVMRTETVRHTSLIRPYVSSDITFLAEIAMAGPIVEVPEVMFFRRVTDTSCGLGNLTPDQVLAWFDPGARNAAFAPMARVFLEIQKVILRSDHSLLHKARILVAFGGPWTTRMSRHSYFMTRRRVRRRVSSAIRRFASAS
jgi:glycosyltransferase involved in cell wall biosynthesis